MKRFLLKFCGLLLGCAVLILALSPGYLKLLNEDYQREQALTLQLKHVDDGIDVACFGSSHSINAFQMYQYTDGDMFNFGLSMQTPECDYMLYQLNRDHFAEDARVVMVISYFSLYQQFIHDLDHMKRYCTFVPNRLLPTTECKLYRLFRAVEFELDPIVTYLTHKQAAPLEWETSTVAAEKPPEQVAAKIDEVAGYFLSSCNEQQRVEPSVDAAIRNMIQDCQKNGFRPVLVTTPLLKEFNAYFDDAFMEKFRADCQAYADAYGIPYLDYSHDARFIERPDLFVDGDHLTTEGSVQFMRIFFEELAAAS